MFDWVLNMLLQYILQNALDVYQLEVLANCLLKLLNRFHHNHCARSEIHVTSCSTYLLNDKNFNTCFITIYFYKLSCSSHIFYADFKLQRNKVQSRKLSFAVIENFDIQFIVLLLNEEKTIEKVSLILQDIYTNKREP